MPGVTYHMSSVTCHLSPVTCHVSHFFLQSGEASQCKVCYQRCLSPSSIGGTRNNSPRIAKFIVKIQPTPVKLLAL